MDIKESCVDCPFITSEQEGIAQIQRDFDLEANWRRENASTPEEKEIAEDKIAYRQTWTDLEIKFAEERIGHIQEACNGPMRTLLSKSAICGSRQLKFGSRFTRPFKSGKVENGQRI